MAAVNNLSLTPYQLGQRFAKSGMKYNPYLASCQMAAFNSGYETTIKFKRQEKIN